MIRTPVKNMIPNPGEKTVCPVTGANRGIGRGSLRPARRRGHAVVLTARCADEGWPDRGLRDGRRRNRGDRVPGERGCPGWVVTHMGGPGGRLVAAGAASVDWAATLPDSGPHPGGFSVTGLPAAGGAS